LSTEKTKIVIVEPNSWGHHFYYVRLLVERALSINNNASALLLTTELATKSHEYQVHLSPIDRLEVQVLDKGDFRLKSLSKHPEVSSADIVCFPDADRLLPQLAMGSWSTSGKSTFLVMRADGEPKKLRGIGVAVGFTKKLLICIGNSRKNIVVYSLKSPLSKRQLPIPWVSDPITLSIDGLMVNDVRNKLSQLSANYWLGVFGYVTPRKNLPIIVEAIMKSSDLGLVIAGTISKDVFDELKPELDWLQNAGRLLSLSGTLEDNELDSAIAAVDCVLAAHSNDGPSGIVAKAAMLGKPLVLAGAKTLKRDAKSLGGQARWSKLDSGAIFLNIASLRDSNYLEYPTFSSSDEFARKLIP
jgi:hypothetical protein